MSDNHPTVVSLLLRRFGLASEFETVHGCSLTEDGLRKRKPDPTNLEAAMDALDAAGGVYVGDRPVDVEAAARAGLDSVLVARDADVSATDSTYRVSTLRELPAIVE